MKWSFMTVDFKLGCKIQISTYAHISEAAVNNQYKNKTKGNLAYLITCPSIRFFKISFLKTFLKG